MNHKKYKECVDACNDCATACGHEKDAQMQAKCVELDRYCADMCRMATAFLARADSHTLEFVKKFVALCAEACTACAVECEKHTHLDHCKECATACRQCAAECEKV